jgi:peptidase E
MSYLLLSKITGSRDLVLRYFHLLGVAPKRIAYISSAVDPERIYFEKAKNEYGQIGIQEFLYCDLYEGFDELILKTIQKSDLIILPGGFTPNFLSRLKQRKLISHLIDFAKGGGSFIGASAGALIMGQNLSILLDDPDEGEATQRLDDISGLGLYRFEFFPHFGRLGSHHDALKTRSQHSKNTILGCDDYSGIISIDGNYVALGNIQIFKYGIFQNVQNSTFFI